MFNVAEKCSDLKKTKKQNKFSGLLRICVYLLEIANFLHFTVIVPDMITCDK